MENRVYYGEYSLEHWLALILKKNLILPAYQRFFVWNEKKVETLMETFKKKQFVPPVTIGAFKQGDKSQNLILDGQQRLTSILLSHLGIYPDKATYTKTMELYADENDDNDEEATEQLDNVLEWTFKTLLKKGNTKNEILKNVKPGNYKQLLLQIDDDFLKNTFLGFSYLVPYITDEKEQQKYYSSVFRNINIQGEALYPQESRASLYFLDKNLIQFFKPEFFDTYIIRTVSNINKGDFVRYLSLLSQFKRDGSTGKIARGYKPKMEKYYEEYIYSIVGEAASPLFEDFETTFPSRNYHNRFKQLEQALKQLDIPMQFNSIIELDMFVFGLIFTTVFEDKKIDGSKKQNIADAVSEKINEFRNEPSHVKAPASLKYLRERMEASIEIYQDYAEE